MENILYISHQKIKNANMKNKIDLKWESENLNIWI